MEPSHTMSVTINGVTFGTEGDPKHEFITTVTQSRHPRGWLVALWLVLGVACVARVTYLVVRGQLMGVALLPVVFLLSCLCNSEVKGSQQYVVTGLVTRHGENAVVLVPKGRPFMGIYIDRAWVFPAGSISYAAYEDGFVRIVQSGGVLDVGMRHGRKIVQSVADGEDIRIRTEGDDAASDGQAIADLLSPRESFPKSTPDGSDGCSDVPG